MNLILVLMVSHTDINKVTPFTIMICPKDQYDWGQSQSMSYQYRYLFLLGMLNGTNGNLTLGGINNLTFQESIETLYNVNPLNVRVDSINSVLQDRFIIPYGYCKELKNYDMNRFIIITTNGNISVFITDPLKTIYYRKSESSMIGDKIDLVAKSTLYNDFLTFILNVHETHLYKDKPGEDCTDYGENNEFLSYNHCKQTELEAMLIPDIGCLPPWMSPSSQCEGKIRQGILFLKEKHHINKSEFFSFDKIWIRPYP